MVAVPAFGPSSCVNRIVGLVAVVYCAPVAFPPHFTSLASDCGRNRSALRPTPRIEARVERRREHKRRRPVAIETFGGSGETARKWRAARLTLTNVQISEATNEQFVTT